MKAILASFLLVIFCTVLNADPYQTFSSVVDFKASLKSLSANPAAINSSKLYLLDGTITAIHRKNSTDGNLLIELEMINSEWVENSTLKTYRAIITIDKPEFSDLFPLKASQKPEPGQIGTNSRILVLVQFLRADSNNDGSIRLNFDALNLRIIK